jgi:hypothetical protein
MKNINNENEENNKDSIAAIGIGAMIVFIALILVAAVASAVIISTGEKLQQNAQKTGSDTQSEVSGKVRSTNVIVAGANVYRVFFESMPGSGNIAEIDINWQLVCSGSSSPESGDFTTAVLTSTGGVQVTPAGIISPGVPYHVDLNVNGDTPNSCGASDLIAANTNEATLWIHVTGGGSTYENLQFTVDIPGTQVV